MQEAASLVTERQTRTLHARGEWTGCRLDGALRSLQGWREPGDWRLDTAAISELDTAGAWALHCVGQMAHGHGARVDYGSLPATPVVTPRSPGLLEGLGRAVVRKLTDAQHFLDFVGHLALEGFAQLRRLRLTRLVQEIDAAGVHALPILGLLAFLMGVVVTYSGR